MIKDSSNPTEVDYINRDNQLEDSDNVNVNISLVKTGCALFIGFTTHQKLLKLQREGDISSAEAKKYFEGIRQFYEATVKCILEKFPLHDETFMHAKFVDFTRREAAEFRDVEYFVERYGAFLSFTQQ